MALRVFTNDSARCRWNRPPDMTRTVREGAAPAPRRVREFARAPGTRQSSARTIAENAEDWESLAGRATTLIDAPWQTPRARNTMEGELIGSPISQHEYSTEGGPG